jgi:hypothetical protein
VLMTYHFASMDVVTPAVVLLGSVDQPSPTERTMVFQMKSNTPM